jgi:hypothetical protein
MNSPREVTGPINVGNPGEFTVKQLAEQITALIGNDAGLEFLPLPQDDPVRRQPLSNRPAVPGRADGRPAPPTAWQSELGPHSLAAAPLQVCDDWPGVNSGCACFRIALQC